VSKVKEFVYLLSDLEPSQIEDLSVGEIKTFLHEQVRIADLKAQIDQEPGLMRQAERFFILQQIDTLAGTPATDGCPARVGRTAATDKGPAIEYRAKVMNCSWI